MTRSEIAKVIDEYIFSQRDRYILKRKMLDDATFDEIANEMDVTTPCVKKRYENAKRILEGHI